MYLLRSTFVGGVLTVLSLTYVYWTTNKRAHPSNKRLIILIPVIVLPVILCVRIGP